MLFDTDIQLMKELFSFWPHLNMEQQNLLAGSASLCRYASGKTIQYGSDSCLGVLLLKKGALRVYLLSEEGREVTLYRLESGDICVLSASCILKSITFDIYIDAESDCEVLQIPSGIYSRIAEENIYAENFSYKQITERFSDVMWAMQQILFTSFDRRLAAFLLDETLKQDNDTLKITHEQIAKYLGSAREVVSRMLKYFSTEGMVLLSRGGITIVDKQKMRKLI